ncbi:hypothetical protein FO519_000483 [Halicephalobus sp. NKZ332]|nr:hypothetical protein FO519_000483 [Halicephalobus sp. NKZ332]
MSNAVPVAIESMVHENVSTHQIDYLKEPCIAVDEDDRILGSISKSLSHQKDTSTLHRAFSVFIFNTKKELLLQKRAPSKITFPNKWTNSCCSHPHFSPEECVEENAIGIRRAAHRKLEHELGISRDVYKPDDFDFVGKFLYHADSDDYWCERELDYVLILKNFDAQLKNNPDEVSATKFVNKNALFSMFDFHPESFSPWFALMYKKGWLDRWWDNLDDLSKFRNSIEITKLN